MKYDKKLMHQMAKSFEEYINIIENYIVIEGLSDEEYKESIKTVKKLIKKLKEGKGHKVFDEEKYLKWMEENNRH